MEKYIDSSDEISTDLLYENDKQQSSSYSIKRNYGNVILLFYYYIIKITSILRNPLFSAHEGNNDTKIGLHVMK